MNRLQKNLKGSLLFQAGPMDAGTDSGFTFTAPNWPTEPRQKISHITAQQPDHPANSFYYPEKKRLPPIATFHFHKVRRQPTSESISDAGIKPARFPFCKHFNIPLYIYKQ
jgi:hypothetical protein